MAEPPDDKGRRAGSRSGLEPRVRPASAVEVDDEPSDVARTFARPTLSRTRTPVRFMLELQEGSPVGEYELQAQIGEGAMGTVYTAIHPLIGKTVAIKVLKPELCANQGSVDRFVQEATAVNRIGHPNIVDVFSLGELPDGRAYFVMEWLRGEDLKVRLARGPLTVSETCDILDGIARALDAAHAKDIVHRDLKPDNVFLHQVDGGPMMVKLLDFGIAKLLRAKAKMEKTQTGNMLGTPRYISPEQARGVDVTHRSDIYSLGVMAYEMLAGRPPFQGETAMDLVVKHLSEPPPPLSQFTRVPKSLEQCVMRMLAKDPAERPTLELMRQILVDPNRRVSQPVLRGKLRKRLLLVGTVVAAAALGVIAWKLLGGDEPSTRGETAIAPREAPAVRVIPPAPAKPVVTRGTVDITVDGPKDAVIFVDNVEWARGAASIKVEVEPGPHEVEVRAAGRDPIVQRIDAKLGANAVAITFPAIASAVPPRTVPRPKPRPKLAPAKPPTDDDGLLKPKGHR